MTNHRKYVVSEGETFRMTTDIKWGKKWFIIVSEKTGIILARTKHFRQAEGIMQELKFAKRSNLSNKRELLEINQRCR